MITGTDELKIDTELENEDVWIRLNTFDVAELFFTASRQGVSICIRKEKAVQLRNQLTKLLEAR